MPMLTGTNLKYTKAHNVRTVLETIRLFGPLSRGDIAQRTELTAQTVSNITRQLIQKDLVLEADRRQEGRGAPATRLVLNPNGAFSIGLDLDKDHLTGILVDFTGNVRQHIGHDLHFPSPEEAIDLMATTAQTLMSREGLLADQIWGVGVGFPGPLGVSEGSYVTNVVNPQAFPGWNNIPVVDILGERLELPIYLENNATAAAVGERWYGRGRHIHTFFYMFFGAGLGGGLIVNGHPFEGNTGNAGELGYFPVNDDTLTDAADDLIDPRPHLGVYFNLPRLFRQLTEQGVPVDHADALAPLFEQQNPFLLDWIDNGATHLAPLILAIEYLIDPEAIFFGGRLPDEILTALLMRLEEKLPAMRIGDKPASPQLCIATAGSDAAALGVATLPFYASLAPTPRRLMKNGDKDTDAPLKPTSRRKR